MDDFDAAANPRCDACGVVMRDEPGGWTCPACGAVHPYDVATRPTGADDLDGFRGG